MKRKRLPVRFTGQHFTIDKVLIADAINIAQLKEIDTVLDIGAGKGFLTSHLTRLCADVIAIEKDNFLVNILRTKFAHNTRAKIIAGDFRKYTIPLRNFKVVSNIPYGITAEILKALMFNSLDHFMGGCLVMQWETAKKLTATKVFNPLTVFYQTFFDLQIIREVAPASFAPPPTVRSALLKIKRKDGLIRTELKQEYLNFISYFLQEPHLPVRTALKKIFRKNQVRELSRKVALNLAAPVASLSAHQWTSCFLEMMEKVPERHRTYLTNT